MNDPIAEAASKMTDTAPSSSEPSILERALDKVHAVEEEIKHLIHPEAASEPQSAAGETAAANAAEEPNATSVTITAAPAESASTPVAGEPGNATAAPASSSETLAAGQSGSAQTGDVGEPSSSPASGAGSVGETGNVSGQSLSQSEQPSGSSAPQPLESGSPAAPAGGEPGNDSSAPLNGTSGAEKSQTISTESAAGADLPNAVASPAVAEQASDTSSSANPVSPDAVTQAVAAYSASLGEQIKASTQRIRKFLWTFNGDAVDHLHAELDKLEKLV